MNRLDQLVRALAAVLGLGVVVATAGPAAADDCDQRLKDAGVLEGVADPAVVEDCIRTGGSFGTTIGIIVGGVGVAIAVAGLPGLRKPPEKPGQGPEPEGDLTDCEKAWDLAPTIEGYLAEIQSFQSEVQGEWQAYLQGAQSLSRELQLMEQLDRTSRYLHITKASARIFLVGALARGLRHLALPGGPTGAPVDATRFAAATQVMAHAGSHGTDQVLDGGALYFGEAAQRFDQIWAGYPNLVQRMMDFNQRMQNWANTREAQLDEAYRHADDLIDRHNQYAADCAAAAVKYGNPVIQPAVKPLSRLARGPSRIDRLVVRPWVPDREFGMRRTSRMLAEDSGLAGRFQQAFPGATFPDEQWSSYVPERWR